MGLDPPGEPSVDLRPVEVVKVVENGLGRSEEVVSVGYGGRGYALRTR